MEDTEFFLPSEIARLVYGHLKATEPADVSEKFFNESPLLTECREMQKRNRTFKTEANGLPLKEILDQYMSINKLILGTVNKLVGDQQKFRDPVEAFLHLLGSSDDKQSCPMVNNEGHHSPGGFSMQSSSSDMFSDFSLNLRTPDKHKRRGKVTKSKLKTLVELNSSVDKTLPETTPEPNKLPPKRFPETIPRQSTRLQLKKSQNKDRCCNSDSVKEIRKSPNDDCETPRKVGKPPYSENKIQKPKKTISLLSSDSESEIRQALQLPNLLAPSSISSNDMNRVNGIFSPERPKKKTLKVMKPRRPPLAVTSTERKGKIKCKRDRVSELFDSSDENKKSKLSDEISALSEPTASREKASRSSDEFVSTTKEPSTTEKQKVRRKSGSNLMSDFAANSVEVNKSLPVIDGTIFNEKIIKNKRLHEHMAATINEVIMNSPQKNPGEDLQSLIDASLEKITGNEMYDRLVDDLLEDFSFVGDVASESSLSTNFQPKSTENETITMTSIENRTQLTAETAVDIEDPPANFNRDDESHNNEQNAIIIEIREDQVPDQETYFTQHRIEDEADGTSVISEEIRHFFRNTPGIEGSPNEKLVSRRYDDENVINVISPDGELLESCKISNDGSERIVLNTNSVLYPVNEHVPVVTIGKAAQFQICGTPSSVSQIVRRKQQYVPIAPKPEGASDLMNEAMGRRKSPKRRRTRGGKRP